MRAPLLPILVLSLLACANTEARLSAYNEQWVGESIDDFVRANGPPVSQFEMSEGGTLYTFVAGEASIQMPSQTRVNTSLAGTTTATTTGGSQFDLACVLSVEADAEGKITAIAIQKDSYGVWTMSRCHEVLPGD